MHLLVLSAFRLKWMADRKGKFYCLNAPSGAQCFPTFLGNAVELSNPVSMHLLVLSAFRRQRRYCHDGSVRVSMHLLVLSAFRPAIA